MWLWGTAEEDGEEEEVENKIMIRTRGITLLIRNKFIPPPSMVFG